MHVLGIKFARFYISGSKSHYFHNLHTPFDLPTKFAVNRAMLFFVQIWPLLGPKKGQLIFVTIFSVLLLFSYSGPNFIKIRQGSQYFWSLFTCVPFSPFLGPRRVLRDLILKNYNYFQNQHQKYVPGTKFDFF